MLQVLTSNRNVETPQYAGLRNPKLVAQLAANRAAYRLPFDLAYIGKITGRHYPLVYLTITDDVLCPTCANYCEATRQPGQYKPELYVIDSLVNWHNPNLECSRCHRHLLPAHATKEC